MPYSMDVEENMKNPASPSEQIPMTEQFLYRFASLESSVNSGFRRLDERLNRFQEDLHESQIITNDRINNIDKEFHEALAFKRVRIDNLQQRVQDLETWQKVIMARVGIIIAAVAVVWTFIAPVLRNLIGVSNG